MICIFGCILQIIEISQIYFSFETSTDVSFETETDVYLPAFTICGFKDMFINDLFENQMKTLFKSSDKQLYESFVRKSLNNLSVDKQFEKLLTVEELSQRIGCYGLKTKNFDSSQMSKDCKGISPIKLSINFRMFCFSFFQQLNNESNDYFLIDSHSPYLHRGYLFSFLYFQNETNLYVMIHNREQDLFDNNKRQGLYLNGEKTTSIFYNRVLFNRLEGYDYKPCRDFSKFGHFNREECLLDCKIRNHRKHLDKIPGRFMITQKYSYLNLYFENNSEMYPKEFLLEDMCEKVCENLPDCREEYFILNMVDGPKDPAKYWISIRRPFIPTIIITQRIKIKLQEFLCYIASIFGLWFGISLIAIKDFFRIVFTSIEKVLIRYKNSFILKMFIQFNCNHVLKQKRSRIHTLVRIH